MLESQRRRDGEERSGEERRWWIGLETGIGMGSGLGSGGERRGTGDIRSRIGRAIDRLDRCIHGDGLDSAGV